MGFISLMLAVTEDHISKICIPTSLADSMLPCHKEIAPQNTTVQNYVNFATELTGNLSLENGLYGNILCQQNRKLAEDVDSADDAGAVSDPCGSNVCIQYNQFFCFFPSLFRYIVY